MSLYTMPFITPAHARQNDTSLFIPAGSKIAMIGTSLTDNGYRDATESSTIRGYTARGAFEWFRVMTNQQFDFYNRGIGGNTIDMMLARYDTDITPLNPDVVFFDAGTNDNTLTIAEYKTKLAQLYAKADTHGAVAVPLTIPMRSLPLSQGAIDKYLEVNEWIKANYPNAIEVNKYFSDETNRPRTDYTVDGIHYSNIGAYAVAKAIKDRINIVGTRDSVGVPLTPNPTLSGAGGSQDAGVTGTMPNGYHFDILSGTSTVTVDTDLGHLRAVFTPSGNAAIETFRIRGDYMTPTANTLYELISRIRLSNWDGWNYVQLRLNKTGGTETLYSYDLRQEVSDFPWPSDAMINDVLMRVEAINSTDTTRITPYIEMGIHGDATGTGQMDVSLWQVQEVQ